MKIKVTEGYKSIREKPFINKSEDKFLFQHEYEKYIPDSYSYLRKNIFFRNNHLFHPPFSFFDNITHCHSKGRNIKAKIRLIAGSMNASETIPKGIIITDEWSGGYFHWLTDALPRLIVNDELCNSHVVILPEYAGKFQYVVDSLNIMRRSFIVVNTNKTVKVNEAIITSLTAPTGNYYEPAILKLKEILLKRIVPDGAKPQRRIYISRKNAVVRKILNETELIDLLTKFNFEIHTFEKYSFAQQVALMNETEFFISNHGAGLTNMMFMQQGASILELRWKNDNHNNCYFSLASANKLKYLYEFCEKAGDNMVVDVKSLEKVLTKFSGRQ